jgi:ABC-type polar amino acid transport system ATPase subunit
MSMKLPSDTHVAAQAAGEPPLAAPVVEMRSVCKWYGHHQVLNDVNLRLTAGERVVICGPSGSGKSTMIRCLNLLEPFQKGCVIVDGIDSETCKDARSIRMRIGMVFQNFNLFPHLTVLQNCMLGQMRVRGIGKADARDTAMHHLSKVRIPEQAQKYPAQLSGGQQQRVAIARALCMQPKIMLFDEPTSALDPEMVGEVLETMIALAEDGMTMICVTHEMGFARRAADRVVFMDKGEIVEAAPAKQFFDSPGQERTQRFLRQILN